MSVSGVQRQHGLGGQASHLPGEPARRRIEPGDIAYARECRAKGWGWQTIGKLTRLNAEDIRKACEPPVRAAPAEAKAHGPRPMWQNALAAIEAGAAAPGELMGALGVNAPTVQGLLRRLRARGFLAGSAWDVGWTITAAGRAALASEARK